MEHRDPQLSQAYRDAAHPEPAPALDARILDAARQGIVKPAVRPRPAWFGWAVPFSTAAVLVLGVTLLFQIHREAPEILESPTAPLPSQLDTPRHAPASAETVEVPPPGTTPPGTTARSKPPIAKNERAPSAEKDTVGTANGTASAGGVTAQPIPAQAGAFQEPPPAPPAAKSQMRPASPPALARDAAEAGAAMADGAADRSAKLPAPAVKAPVRAGAVDPAMEWRSASETATESPQQLLETIRRLIREDRLDAARQALDRLRRAYPGFELPEDVKGLSIR